MPDKRCLISLLSITIVVEATCILFFISPNLGWNAKKSATGSLKSLTKATEIISQRLTESTTEITQRVTQETRKRKKTRPLVFGKELQSVFKYLADDVLVSVRTTSAYHSSRLSVLLLTWIQSLSLNQVEVI